MRVGVISDTHGLLRPQAVQALRGADLLIHAGDIGTPEGLVRRQAESGRLALYLSAHIGRRQGQPTPEALVIIRQLTEFATQRQFVYQHHWTVKDLVIWDNRCTMHRGLRYDDKVYPRDLRRVTLEDVGPTLEQAL